MESKTMRINCRRRLLGSVVIALLGSSGQSAFATQGTFPHGYGVKSEGMGGVAIALAQDAMVGATNPAGMVLVGNRVDLGAAFLEVDNGAYFAGTRYDGSADKSLYIIPQLGANWMLDEVSSLGVTVVGNGVGTNYDNDDNIGGLKAASSELKQMVTTVSYAHKLGEAHALGVGVVLARQVLDIGGTASIGLPEGRDDSYGAGMRLGWTWDAGRGLQLGAMWASKVDMGRMDAFEGLLPEGGNLDIPESYGVGASYVKGAWTFGIDAQRILWSDVRAFGNDGVGAATGAPGSKNGPGFGWRDQTIWRVGAAYAVDSQWTLRAGYNHGTRLLDSRDTYLGVLAPSANRRHLTLGASLALKDGSEFSVAYARSFKETVHGTGAAPDGLTALYMGQHWLSASYSFRF
jgi:long-chain fatty acid transport protein